MIFRWSSHKKKGVVMLHITKGLREAAVADAHARQGCEQQQDLHFKKYFCFPVFNSLCFGIYLFFSFLFFSFPPPSFSLLFFRVLQQTFCYPELIT